MPVNKNTPLFLSLIRFIAFTIKPITGNYFFVPTKITTIFSGNITNIFRHSLKLMPGICYPITFIL